MSDLPPEVIAAAKESDKRFQTIDLGIEVEDALRRGRPLWLLVAKLREEADQATETLLKEFAHCNPADPAEWVKIRGLQASVFRFRYTFETLNDILTRARIAEMQIRSEDQIERERND